MKILVATPLSPDEVGGPATHTEMLLQEFPKHSIEPTVVSFKDVRHLKIGVRQLTYLMKIWRAAKSHDVIYALDAMSVGLPAAIVAKFRRKRLIVRVPGIHAWEQGVQRHALTDNLDEFSKRDINELPRKVKTWLKIQNFVIRHAQKVVVPSLYMQKILINLGVPRTKVEVVYSNFESKYDMEVIDRPREGNTIVSVGRLVPWKGYKTLIDILPSIREGVPDAKLIIIGDGTDRVMLEKRVQEKGLENAVIFTGNIPHNEVEEYLESANVFALNTGYEGFSHTILEAIDVGVPVVTTNVGGNPELIENMETGRLVEPDDTRALAEAIATFLLNPETAKRYARKAKESTVRYGRETTSQKLMDILRRKNVLMLSTERTIFQSGATARKRMMEYAALTDQLHIIIYATKDHKCPDFEQIGENLFLYGTNSRNRWFYFLDAIRLKKKIKTAHIDLVTTQDPFETGLAGWRLARKFDARLQMQVHTDAFNPEFAKHSRLNAIRAKMAPLLIPRADCVRAVSERIAGDLVTRRLALNPVVLPLYVDTTTLLAKPATIHLRETYPHIEGFVIYVGRLEPEKDFSTTLRAFKILLKKYKQAGLLVLGDGGIRKELEWEARILGVGERVEFVGHTPDIVSYYRDADVFIGSSRYEGNARALVEAVAFETPVVSTDVGVIGSWFENETHALVCSSGDPECLGNQLIRIFDDPEGAQDMAHRAKEALGERAIASNDEYLARMRTSFEECGS